MSYFVDSNNNLIVDSNNKPIQLPYPAKLPVFKDKVMYIGANQNKYKIEQSYVISASYNGILRLSPNNYNTIYEHNPIELTAAQDESISSSYSDAIVFEDTAIDNTKTNADITRRMIICSDSDGYLVNFRLSDKHIEFDNLGVIGITKTSKLTIYTNDRLTDATGFILGNTIMPTLPNNIAEIDENIINRNPETYDEIKIDITGKGDNSYILSGSKNSDGKRIFSYYRTQKFIRDIIFEALLSFQSVPTGSIHWFPVTYEQYRALVNHGQYPNKYYELDETGNKRLDKTGNKIECDPMIRDYLLCDGRKYKSEQFPELAKILIKANITYWDNGGCRRNHINTNKKNKIDDENAIVEYDTFFRVPDLRAKFISYCHTNGVLEALSKEPVNNDGIITKDGENGWNVTGVYTPDNSPQRPSGQTGEHFHFISYGTYTPYNCGYNSRNGTNIYNFKGYEYKKSVFNNKQDNPRLWYLWNSPINHSTKSGKGGFSYGFSSSGNRRRDPDSRDSIQAWASFSAPDGGHKNHKEEPSLGLTSKSQMIYEIPDSNEDAYKITKYETWDDYVELESNITQESTENEMQHRYGHENAPKFYAFLPLIKI